MREEWQETTERRCRRKADRHSAFVQELKVAQYRWKHQCEEDKETDVTEEMGAKPIQGGLGYLERSLTFTLCAMESY